VKREEGKVLGRARGEDAPDLVSWNPRKKNALMSQQFDGTVGNGQVRAKL
jgi:hypothetical protein